MLSSELSCMGILIVHLHQNEDLYLLGSVDSKYPEYLGHLQGLIRVIAFCTDNSHCTILQMIIPTEFCSTEIG